MTKYRPIQDRMLVDMKAGDLVSTKFYGSDGSAHIVIHINDDTVWIRQVGKDHCGFLCGFTSIDKIVEPIPEPKIEVSYKPVSFFASDEFKKPKKAMRVLKQWGVEAHPGSCIVKLTRTDGKITSVELVDEKPAAASYIQYDNTKWNPGDGSTKDGLPPLWARIPPTGVKDE